MDKNDLKEIGKMISKTLNINTDFNSKTVEQISKDGLPYYGKYLLFKVFQDITQFIGWIVFFCLLSYTTITVSRIISATKFCG